LDGKDMMKERCDYKVCVEVADCKQSADRKTSVER
jgi:hypothetical protein